MIEHRDDKMQTPTRFRPTRAWIDFMEQRATTSSEVDFRMQRLRSEAARERLAGRHASLRRTVGHALIALGRAIHGMEAEPSGRPEPSGRTAPSAR